MISFLLALTLGSGANAATVDRVVAVVNDDIVLLSELYDIGAVFIAERCKPLVEGGDLDAECVKSAEAEVLDSLMLRALVRQELVKLGLDITTQEIDQQIDRIAADNQIASRDDFRRQVEASGLAWDDYVLQLSEQIRQMKFAEAVIRPRIVVTDDEVVDLYNRTAREYQSEPKRKLEALVLAVPPGGDPEALHQLHELALRLRAEINGGQRDWKTAVQEFTAMFKEQGGDMGDPVSQSMLFPALQEPVFRTDVGQISEPIDVGNSVFLVKVVSEDLQGGNVLPLDQVRGRLEEKLYQDRMDEEVEQWYQQTRRNAAVKELL